jgi:hypothetical protein
MSQIDFDRIHEWAAAKILSGLELDDKVDHYRRLLEAVESISERFDAAKHDILIQGSPDQNAHRLRVAWIKQSRQRISQTFRTRPLRPL